MSMGHEHLLEQVARVGQELPAGPVAAGLEALASDLASRDARTDKNVHPTVEDAPSGNGGDGRDAKGRFAAGNKGGPGNPFAREVARIRKRIQAKLSDEEIDAIMDALMAKARSGDVAAAKLLFSYGAGKPAASVDPDQLDVQEWQHWKSTANMMYDLPQMIRCMMPEILLEMVRLARPLLSAELSKTMGQALADPESVLPPMPELVMARSDKPLKRARRDTCDLATGNGAAGDPRCPEHLAAGPEHAEEPPTPNGHLPNGRRRAWGLSPTPNGGRGGKKNREQDRRPSAKGDNGRPHAEPSGAPSRNGVLGR